MEFNAVSIAMISGQSVCTRNEHLLRCSCHICCRSWDVLHRVAKIEGAFDILFTSSIYTVEAGMCSREKLRWKEHLTYCLQGSLHAVVAGVCSREKLR